MDLQIPNTVEILGLTYSVKITDTNGDDGYIVPGKQVIVIDSKLKLDRRAQTFLHELVHGILDQLGYSELYEDEKLVQGIALGLHSAIRSVE